MPGTNNILVTGGSGFLGKYILEKISAPSNRIYSLGRKSIGENHITADFKNPIFTLPQVYYSKVIHLAGKAHMLPRTEEERSEFHLINFKATEHLLAQLEKNKTFPEVFIFASTSAVYGKNEGEGIMETDPLLANTPYGISKLKAENSIMKWCEKNNVKYAILRLPLIAGSNPPGNLGAIKKAIKSGIYFSIKNNQARKSIVLASDIADLIANQIWTKSGIFNLTDGIHPTFNEVEFAIEAALKSNIKLKLPLSLVKTLAGIGDLLQNLKLPSPLNSQVLRKMTFSLTFNDNKARKELNWNPNPVIPFLEKHV